MENERIKEWWKWEGINEIHVQKERKKFVQETKVQFHSNSNHAHVVLPC